ncbi:MAG: lysylphosphatidylglycerol synthase domain-containing protein [Flavobacteriales bacterium]
MKKQRNMWMIGLKWLAVLAALAFLVVKLKDQTHLLNPNSLDWEAPHLLLAACLLMPINWIIESIKWKKLTADFAPLSLKAAIKAVLIGVFYTMFTPNRVGEGAGRLHSIPPGNKSRAGYAFVLGSGAQLLTTLLMGGLGLIYFSFSKTPEPWLNSVYLLVLLVLLVLVVGLYISPFRKNIQGIAQDQQGFFASRIATLQQYKLKMKAQILFLSILRYVVFSTQFVLCLLALQPNHGISELYARVATVYLGSTIIPSFALAEIGLRESLAILIFETSSFTAPVVFQITLLVWVINLLLPALIGVVAFFQSKKGKS